MLFQKGDIVLNFRRYKAYAFDPAIDWQRKEQSYCRLATISERKKVYRVMKKKHTDLVSFADIGLRASFINRWKYFENVKEQINLSRWQVYHFERIMKQHQFSDYSQVIDYLLEQNKSDCNPALLIQMQTKIEKMKTFAKQLDKLVSDIKKLLFNIIF